MNNIRSIAIIGSGRAAQYFGNLFYAHNYRIDIISRNSQTGTMLATRTGGSYSSDFRACDSADMILLCVNDDQVLNVLTQLPAHENQVVCHCAGAMELNVLRQYAKYGVIYPLQSLGPELGNAEVPFLLEASDGSVQEQLERLLLACGKSFHLADSTQRRVYHMAAVFANNFTNAMLMATEDISEKLNLDFNILKPLIAQTFNRLEKHMPSEVQTGPAQRNDKETMSRHLELLAAYPELQKLYTNISGYIVGRKTKK